MRDCDHNYGIMQTQQLAEFIVELTCFKATSPLKLNYLEKFKIQIIWLFTATSVYDFIIKCHENHYKTCAATAENSSIAKDSHNSVLSVVKLAEQFR